MCSIWPTAAARSLRGEQAIRTFVVSRHALHAGRQHRDERLTARCTCREGGCLAAPRMSQVQMLGASPRTVWKVLQHNIMGMSWVYLLAAANTMAEARRGGRAVRSGIRLFCRAPPRSRSGFGDSAGG